MFSGKEDPRVKTATGNMENLFMHLFERKRRIVERVKQHVDLFDEHLASKCRLEGVSPPSWLCSPPLPSQNFELNKERIISELLCPQSRPSTSRHFSYQQPVSVVRQDLTSLVNNPLEEQLLEEEQQQHLSHNFVRQASNDSHEQDANMASPRDVHEEEGLPESVSTCFRENQSCPSPKYSQNQVTENNLDATSPGHSQRKMFAQSVPTTGCEQKPLSPMDCQDETEPNTCLDPGLSVAKIQRSKSRQKALELRSSAKASRSRSNNRGELKPSPSGNIGLGIASLRSDSFSEIKLFKHDENDKDCVDKVENSSSQGKEKNQCIKFSSTTEPSTPYQEVDAVQKSLTRDPYASNVPESPLKFGHVNEMDVLQSVETIAEVSAKVDKQVDDPQSRICSETAYRDGGTSSKSSSQDILQSSETIDEVSAILNEQFDDPQIKSCNETAVLDGGTSSKSLSRESYKREHQMSSKSVSQDFLSKNSNPSHELELSRPRSSAAEEESANEYKALSVGSDHKTADKQLEVRSGDSSSRAHDLLDFVKPESPCLGNYEERNFEEVRRSSREKSTMEKAPTPESATRVLDVPSLTGSEVNLSADSDLNDTEDHTALKEEMVQETEAPASHSGLKVGENEPPESNTVTGHMDAVTKGPQHETSSDKGVPPVIRNIACTETGESHGPKSSIREIICSSSSMGASQMQNKRRRILDKATSTVPSSSPGADILDPDSVRETVHHMEEAACHNLDHYDVELQNMIGSASTDHFDVELQKMIGSASSAELRFEEGCLFKEAALMSPASLSFRPEQLTVQRSHIAPTQGFELEDMDFLPFAGEASHQLASCTRDSDCSPCLSPLHLTGSDDGSLPVLEGFIIQTDDENQSGSKSQIKHDSFQLPRTTAENATIIEQICKSVSRTTSSLHLSRIFKPDMDLDQSVSTELRNSMFFSQNLEDRSVVDNFGINHDSSGRLKTDCLPFSGAGSFADARNPRTSPNEKLWYRSLQNSSSSEKRGSQTPDLPCISEENENVDEEAENLCANTPKPMSLEKRGSSVLDLPCIAEENEILEVVNEATECKRDKVSTKRKPLGDVNEDAMTFLPSASKAKILVDRQSLDSVSTAFSFSAKCNNSVQSKKGRQNGGNRRFTGKGKEKQGGAGTGLNAKPPSSRFSKAKLSCSSSLTSLRPRLPEKETRYNNIVSNITSFVPLVQQQKPAAALITGKRDVKVKALEAAEASKRIAEQKENDRKMKKEAMKLERARQEQENLRKQEMEKKKKEEDRKKKEAEMTLKQEMEKKKKEEERKRKEAEMTLKLEMEKKKKEEERKRKEFEMAERKRQREEEDKKLKEAKRQRIVDTQRQQREADQKLQAEKELKRQAMDARIKAQKELKENVNPEKTREQANTRIPEVRSKSISSNDTNASRSSRDDDFKVISNQGKMSEESYDISPYKCSDDEEEEEDDEDDLSNNKFVPTWACKSNVILSVMSQQNRDPDMNFPAKSFCPISKIVLPRKLRSLNSGIPRH